MESLVDVVLHWIYIAGLILGLRPANERRRYKVTPSHWLGANLESALYCVQQHMLMSNLYVRNNANNAIVQ